MKTENEFASNLISNEFRLDALIEDVRLKILENTTFRLPPRTDESFITKFIRCKKYDVEAATKAIEKYYNNIYTNLRIMEGIRPKDFAQVYNLGLFKILKSQINGSRVAYYRIGNWNPKKVTIREVELAAAFLFEELLNDSITQLNGFIIITDMSGLSCSHVWQLNYHEIKFLVKCVFEMFPMRVSGLHFVNVSNLFWPMYKLGMKVLPAKIQSRVHLHSDTKSLANMLDAKCLPKSLGGVLGEEQAWDGEQIPEILNRNLCYDTYWTIPNAVRLTRRLTRKRSSMMMVS